MTTADPATYASTFPLTGASWRPDPVRARVSVGSQSTYSEGLTARTAMPDEVHLSGLHLVDTKNGGPRRPHPADVLYWVACLGGAGLLILCGTT